MDNCRLCLDMLYIDEFCLEERISLDKLLRNIDFKVLRHGYCKHLFIQIFAVSFL